MTENYTVQYYRTLLDLEIFQGYESNNEALQDAQDYLSKHNPSVVIIDDHMLGTRRIWIRNGEATYRVRDLDDFNDRIEFTLNALCIDPEHSKTVNKQP